MGTKNIRGCGKCTCRLHTLSRLQSGNIYIHTCMCINVTTVNKRSCHGFEREHGVAYRRVWEEERKGKGKMLSLYYVVPKSKT